MFAAMRFNAGLILSEVKIHGLMMTENQKDR